MVVTPVANVPEIVKVLVLEMLLTDNPVGAAPPFVQTIP